MKSYFLSRKTDFYFWTGLVLAVCTFFNFGYAFAEVWYAESNYSFVSAVILALATLLAFYFFWSQQSGKGAKESGCFAGITTILVVFNLLYNLLLLLFSVKAF